MKTYFPVFLCVLIPISSISLSGVQGEKTDKDYAEILVFRNSNGFPLSHEVVDYVQKTNTEEKFPNSDEIKRYRQRSQRFNPYVIRAFKERPDLFEDNGRIEKIPKVALPYLRVWRVDRSRGYESLHFYEDVFHLISRINEANNLAEVAKDLVHDENKSESERLESLRKIFPPNCESSKSKFGHYFGFERKELAPDEKSLEDTYVSGVINNLPSVPEYGEKFDEKNRVFYQRKLEEADKMIKTLEGRFPYKVDGN